MLGKKKKSSLKAQDAIRLQLKRKNEIDSDVSDADISALKAVQEETLRDEDEAFYSERKSDVRQEILEEEPKEGRRKSRRKMKRKKSDKLCAVIKYGEESREDSTFNDFSLDERLQKAVAALGWEKPTQIQQNMIPLALEGKNITARARTGSGKTAAFMLPIIQKIIQLTSTSDRNLVGPFALFIAPSKELAFQLSHMLTELTQTFPFLVSMNYADLEVADEDIWITDNPDMVVSTPSRLLHVLRKRPGMCAEVRHVVLDEADLLLSYGYEDDMKQIKNFLPQHHQTIFTSATLTEDVSALKTTYMTGPVVTLKLKECQLPDADQLSQYQIYCRNDEERFAILLSMIKLKLIVGKSIIFVSDTDRCYKLGLFLQAFQICSCILNARMPANSRCHVVEEFNQGRYTYVIASDTDDIMPGDAGSAEVESPEAQRSSKELKSLKKMRRKLDKESGVARGIDFHHVSNVINFDFPKSVNSYIHRVGRTARGWNKGAALSFVSPEERQYFEEVQTEINYQMGRAVIVPYEIRINELDSFVLRAREALTACTKAVIREARLAEIRAEALRSKKLEGYFVKNPREKAMLEHDKKLRTLSLHSPAIADVPEYMVPPSLRGLNYGNETRGRRKVSQRHRQKPQRIRSSQAKYQKKMDDPLQSFSL